MKYRDYEKLGSIYFLFGLFLVLFIVCIIISFRVSIIKKYQMLSGVYVGKNQVMILVSSRELSWFYRNNWILIDGRRVSFTIDRLNKDMIKREGVEYHQLFLGVEIDSYTENDSVSVFIFQKKISFRFMFFDIWKGG